MTEIVYQHDLFSEEDRQGLIQYGFGHSVIDTGIMPTPEDAIITLSTCSGSGLGGPGDTESVKCPKTYGISAQSMI